VALLNCRRGVFDLLLGNIIFDLFNLKDVGNIVTDAVCFFVMENREGEDDALRYDAAHFHCLNFIMFRLKKREVRIVGRHNAVNFNVDCKIANLKFILFYDTLPAEYAGELDFVSSFDGAEPCNLFDVSKFSHNTLQIIFCVWNEAIEYVF